MRLGKLGARPGPLLDRTSHLPVTKLLLGRKWMTLYRHLAVFGGFSILGTVLVWPIFGPDYPPGVDTATFLHLSWVTKLAASGQLADPFQDPYWYGGFSYLAAYPPLGYGLVGVISFVTRLDLISVYIVLLVLAHGGLAAATYSLASEMGLSRWTASLAGVLTALAYPVLSAIFMWGWFTSVMALPFGLVALMLLERALRSGKWQPAAWGGLFMALSILTHHMTGLSLGLGMLGWYIFHTISGIYSRRQVVVFSGLFVAVTFLVVLPWGIPFIIHILDAGFRREVPGLWLPELAAYRTNVVDSSLIGEHIYPSYLGITLMVLAIGGVVYALLERRRLAGLAIVLLVLVWFSMGSNANPLIRVYPFSGLDVARFHLFMVPFMALLGAALVERLFSFLRDLWPAVTRRLPFRQSLSLSKGIWYGLVVAVLSAILVFPALDAKEARGHTEPYQIRGSVAEAMDWLAERPPSVLGEAEGEELQGRIYSVGLWTWHTFLIPYLTDWPLVDGWHDEGAPNVNKIRELRLMGWTGNVDIQRTHQLLSELGAEYVLIKRISDYPIEASEVFWEGFESHPEWFQKREQWENVAVFQVLPLASLRPGPQPESSELVS